MRYLVALLTNQMTEFGDSGLFFIIASEIYMLHYNDGLLRTTANGKVNKVDSLLWDSD
jgi:hypothetical protein